jgi:hypothetical protein
MHRVIQICTTILFSTKYNAIDKNTAAVMSVSSVHGADLCFSYKPIKEQDLSDMMDIFCSHQSSNLTILQREYHDT